MKKILLLILTLVGIIGLAGCINTTTIEGVEFQLNGDLIVNITTAESYLELGYTATDNGEDINSYVSSTGTVDSSTPGTYILKYTLIYNGKTMELIRAINVVETTEVANPDAILYNGSCANVQIHYIDLGSMGDSTLIDCGDFEILIDAGLKSAGTEVIVPYITPFVGDGILELVIATHPDADHIGGFVGLSDQDGIFDAFTVLRVLDYGYTKTTTTHEQYAELRDNSGALVCSGDDALNSRNLCQPYYTITADLILGVIDTGHYDGVDTNNDNENSIVVLLEHGERTYLFTGDAEFEAEEHMATILSHVDVYKAGHHGSKTASSQAMLDSITPNVIILGVYFPEDDDGENGYGIPQQESLDRMFGFTDDIYATGVSGTIIITSDGTSFSVSGALNTTLLKDSSWFASHRTYPTE